MDSKGVHLQINFLVVMDTQMTDKTKASHTPGPWELGWYKSNPTVFDSRGNGTIPIATCHDLTTSISKKVYQHRKQCKYCQKIFYAHNTNKKYCTYECSGLARSDSRHEMQPNDPTPDEIADMCRKIRSGELVIHSSPEHDGAMRRGSLRPSWVLKKKLR